MDLVDRQLCQHAAALTKILTLSQQPHRCRVTRRVKEDLVRLKLAKGDVLAEVLMQVKNEALPIYCQLQTMYEETPCMGYVFCPLTVKGIDLYVKLILPQCDSERSEYLLMLAAHEPQFPCPKVHK